MSGPKRADVIAKLDRAEEAIRQQMAVMDKCEQALSQLSFVQELASKMEEAEQKMAGETDAASKRAFGEAQRLYRDFQSTQAEAMKLRDGMKTVMAKVRSKVSHLRANAWGGYQQDDEARSLQRQAQQGLEDYKRAYQLSEEAVDLSRKASAKLTVALDKQKEAAAKRAAEGSLKSALEEVGDLDFGEIEKWTRQEKEARQALKTLGAVRDLIEKRQFDAAESQIDASLKRLREILALMRDNQAKAQQRVAMAKAIIEALMANHYQTPDVYNKETASGRDDDVLEPLIIYAKERGENAPSITYRLELGDTQLHWEYSRLDQNGNELPLTDQDHVACVDKSKALQEALAAQGFETVNVDYGKGRVVAQPDKVKQKVSVIEKGIEREG